ncbi:hypothetical protein BDN67DRAFT_386602 [Paxillus ammoniavirescens]|nr:hypothetical protein BDN67DRAFT_386602 [Paxillus ammoniavirescens]
MFMDSIEAGAAGNQQWGLDAGSHQHGWNPYEGLPSHWNVGYREYSETELKHGPHYSGGSEEEGKDIAKPSDLHKRPRPRPRLRLANTRNVKPRLE